jgi:penicillin-binding protein 2
MKSKLPIFEKGNYESISVETYSTGSNLRLLTIYAFLVLSFFLVALLRLFHLSVVKGSYYQALASDNRLKEVVIEAPRGSIFDRKGILLAGNTNSEVTDFFSRANSYRVYYASESASHVLGYRQLADKTDLQNDPCLNKLKLGDKTGKKGIEQLFDCDLRGVHGQKMIEVDALGSPVRVLNIVPPIAGKELHISIDSMLQEIAYKSLGGRKGAVAGIKPSTGEVLILTSSPGFSPQIFEDSNSEEVKKTISSSDKKLFNRALEGNYPPGSTFKMFVAAAGLEEGVIRSEEKILDKGFIEAGPLKFHNWYYLEYGKTDGEVDLIKSLQRSNDIYYYLLGAKLGPDRIRRWAELFGFQNKTGIGLNEVAGIVPSAFWKEETLKTKWFLGDTYNLSIGQGYVTANPLQVTLATSVFANGGYYCQSKILKSASEKDKNCRKVPMSEDTYKVIREGMLSVCVPGGTGHPFFNFSVKDLSNSFKEQDNSNSTEIKKTISVGCKTGTAESQLGKKPHAWFTIFAPYEDPEIVLTVLVEEGGQGSDIAAPIAKEVLTSYFERLE